MQDKTINNALIALAKQGGPQGSIAEGLLLLRDVPLPIITQDRPLTRGGTRKLILRALQEGPCTASCIGSLIQKRVTGISNRAAYNRGYQALLRLEGRGLVQKRDEWPRAVWLLARNTTF
jgi:hypothetical protein